MVTSFNFSEASGTFEAREGTAYQKDPPKDLKVVSWPPGKQDQDLNYYAYERSGGKNVMLYVIEEGIDLRNSVIYHFSKASLRTLKS